mgnify:CR=1 FL=1
MILISVDSYQPVSSSADLLKNLIPDIATAALPPLPASAITGSRTTLAASVAEANGAKLGPSGLLVQVYFHMLLLPIPFRECQVDVDG